MAIKFNPLTGNFDFTGSGGGGGGASYIDGEVATYADLPLDGSAALNSAWLVRTASGVWPVSRKQAGIYIRTATGGSSRDADYTYAGTMPDVFSDAQFTLYGDVDSTKNVKFNVDAQVGANQTRVITVPNKNITLDDAGDSRTPTAHAASHLAGTPAIAASYTGIGDNESFSEEVTITANTAGTAGNSITLTFDGVDDVDTVLAAWNSANPLNQASLDSGDGAQVPDNGDELTLSGGVASTIGSDPIYDQDLSTTDEPTFNKLTLTPNQNDSSLRLGTLEFQGYALNNAWIGDNVYYNGSNFKRRNSGAATLFYFQGEEGQFRSDVSDDAGTNVTSLPNFKVGAGGKFSAGGPNVSNQGDFENGALWCDGDYVGLSDTADETKKVEFDVSGVTTETTRTLEIPDASGKIALTSDNADQFGSGAAADGYVLTSDGAGGSAWEAATGGGGGDTVSIQSTAADILSVSSGAISADDAGADRIVYWNNTSNKLTYGTPSDVGAAASSHTHSDATQSVAGFLSTADKTKLDGISSGANNYTHPNHTGDVTSAGDGATTIANNAVTNAKLAQVASSTLKGRATAGTGNAEDLTASQVRTLINVADGATANASDAQLRDRATHTGTQAATTITGLATVATTGAYGDLSGRPTLGTAAAAATTDFAAASHAHAASAITSGTLDVARIPTGTTSTTVALGNHGHELTSLAATGATNGHVLTANGSGGVTFSAASGGGIGGSTGATDNSLLRADGTGGSTAQSSDLVIDDYTATTQGNITLAPRAVSFSATIAASDDFVTATGHTFSNGDQVVFTSLTGGAGLTANIRYFVRDSATNVFKVATTVSGAAVDVTTNYTAATVERIVAVVITTRNVAPFIVGPKPDGTAVGGDARGLRAINIAMSRDASTEVASGNDSIAIGTRSSASGSNSVAVGRLARANTTSATAVGQATNAGQSATAIGTEAGATGLASIAVGNAVTANAQDAVAIGSYDANDTGAIATAIRCVGLNAIANMRGMLATRPFNAVYWGGQTTSDTANVELNLDATATNRMVIAANTAVIADIFLIARRTDNTKFLSARRWVAIRRDGSNNTALIGAVQTIGTDQSEGSPTWTFTIDADDTASVESLRVRVTGAASETVNWRVCAIYRVVA